MTDQNRDPEQKTAAGADIPATTTDVAGGPKTVQPEPAPATSEVVQQPNPPGAQSTSSVETKTSIETPSSVKTTATVETTTVQPINPTSTFQKAIWAVALILVTTVIGKVWFCVFDHLERVVQTETVVAWQGPASATLKAGPASFVYDREAKSLRYKGPIDSKLKSELIELLSPHPAGKVDDGKIEDGVLYSYSDAISQLAYQSNAPLRSIFFLLLSLGGLSGVMGVQLRSLINFVNIVCYKNALDMTLWWPWYVLRPLIGFCLGILTVILLKSELLSVGDKAPTGSAWWVSIAFLAGFGSSEFTERLRLLTKTLFGQSK